MSNILETLYILVKLETEEIKKGLDDTQGKVKQLEGSFEAVGKASDHTSSSFHGALRSVLGLAAGFASFHAVLNGASGAVSSIRDVGQASRELNVDVTQLDAWGHAVQRTGGTAQQFQSTLAALSQHFGTTNEIALRALPRLADAFSKLNPRQAQNYGKSLGIDQATILLLQQGRREVEDTIRQQQRLGLVTQQQVEITRKFDNALYDSGRAYQEFYRQLLIPLLPGFTKAIEYLTDHKDLVVGTFIGIGAAAAVLAAPFIAANAAVTGTTAAVLALVGAFALVFEDIKKFREGAPSLIGYLQKHGEVGLGGISLSAKSISNGLDSINQYVGIHPFNAFSSPGKNTTITIGDVNINTAATDASGIAAAARGSLQEQLSQLNSQIDNGVHA